MAIIVICEYVRCLSIFKNRGLLSDHFVQQNYSCIQLTKGWQFLKIILTKRVIIKVGELFSN